MQTTRRHLRSIKQLTERRLARESGSANSGSKDDVSRPADEDQFGHEHHLTGSAQASGSSRDTGVTQPAGSEAAPPSPMRPASFMLGLGGDIGKASPPPPMNPSTDLGVLDLSEPPPRPPSPRPFLLKAPPPRHLWLTQPAVRSPAEAHDELTYLLQRDAAVPLERQRRVALDGKTYFWVEFKEWYGLDAVRCWNEAGPGVAAVHCFNRNG